MFNTHCKTLPCNPPSSPSSHRLAPVKLCRSNHCLFPACQSELPCLSCWCFQLCPATCHWKVCTMESPLFAAVCFRNTYRETTCSKMQLPWPEVFWQLCPRLRWAGKEHLFGICSMWPVWGPNKLLNCNPTSKSTWEAPKIGQGTCAWL